MKFLASDLTVYSGEFGLAGDDKDATRLVAYDSFKQV